VPTRRRYNRALGDEFAILLNRIEDVNYATSIAERIKQELALPFNLNGHEVFTSATLELSWVTKHSWLDDLLRTNIAMYHAKAVANPVMRYLTQP